MEGRRCGIVLGGDTDHKSCGGEGALGSGREEGEGGGREMYKRSQKENISPMPLTGNRRGADFQEVLKPLELKEWSVRSARCGRCETQWFCSAPMKKERRPSGRGQAPRSPWGTLGESVILSWSASGRGIIVSMGIIVLEGSITLPHLLAYAQRHLHRAANLDAVCCALVQTHTSVLWCNCPSGRILHRSHHGETLPGPE